MCLGLVVILLTLIYENSPCAKTLVFSQMASTMRSERTDADTIPYLLVRNWISALLHNLATPHREGCHSQWARSFQVNELNQP